MILQKSEFYLYEVSLNSNYLVAFYLSKEEPVCMGKRVVTRPIFVATLVSSLFRLPATSSVQFSSSLSAWAAAWAAPAAAAGSAPSALAKATFQFKATYHQQTSKLHFSFKNPFPTLTRKWSSLIMEATAQFFCPGKFRSRFLVVNLLKWKVMTWWSYRLDPEPFGYWENMGLLLRHKETVI